MHEDDADAREWDAFYDAEGRGAPVWSGLPNGTLVAEVADLDPGTALDVGCGEGGDAIWLAQHGWLVTALDPSRVALNRAEAAAREAQLDVRWIQAGLLAVPGGTGAHDLVSVQYPVLPRSEAAIAALLAAVAPGGTLLFVHHDLAATVDEDQGEHGHDARDGHRFDPADHVMPDDVAAALDDGWVIEVHETRPRPGHLPARSHNVDDIVLRARRVATT